MVKKFGDSGNNYIILILTLPNSIGLEIFSTKDSLYFESSQIQY